MLTIQWKWLQETQLINKKSQLLLKVRKKVLPSHKKLINKENAILAVGGSINRSVSINEPRMQHCRSYNQIERPDVLAIGKEYGQGIHINSFSKHNHSKNASDLNIISKSMADNQPSILNGDKMMNRYLKMVPRVYNSFKTRGNSLISGLPNLSKPIFKNSRQKSESVWIPGSIGSENTLNSRNNLKFFNKRKTSGDKRYLN